jgi:hypothetical protein
LSVDYVWPVYSRIGHLTFLKKGGSYPPNSDKVKGLYPLGLDSALRSFLRGVGNLPPFPPEKMNLLEALLRLECGDEMKSPAIPEGVDTLHVKRLTVSDTPLTEMDIMKYVKEHPSALSVSLMK